MPIEAQSNLPWPIEMLAPRSLSPAERNARTHSKKQIREIAELDDPIRRHKSHYCG